VDERPEVARFEAALVAVGVGVAPRLAGVAGVFFVAAMTGTSE
jgi:hypothetical protein